jgi:hypothetical protein
VLGGAAKIGPQETLSSTLIYQPAQDWLKEKSVSAL